MDAKDNFGCAGLSLIHLMISMVLDYHPVNRSNFG